ncbi:MAG: hypothetical protein M3P08_09065 [Thermoproteota archaeon]|jgi:hypothetical protein|nr:hypothetical protein [Thermoproteota archaeon]
MPIPSSPATSSIKLDPISSSPLSPGQSITVTGSLAISGNLASFQGGQSIRIDGTGVANSPCTSTTNSDGLFSCTFTTLVVVFTIYKHSIINE